MPPSSWLDRDEVGRDLLDDARLLGDDDVTGVDGGAVLHAGADQRASLRSSGTAWRCMFEPIRARLASSCSRNGIMAVATDTIWRGETSM